MAKMAIRVGQGYTLKGSGITDPDVSQTTLCRKPNNGLIDNIVVVKQLLLAGNPYPSALDAEAYMR
jgi:hypothetical protein